jgi:hypothetical protein
MVRANPTEPEGQVLIVIPSPLTSCGTQEKLLDRAVPLDACP